MHIIPNIFIVLLNYLTQFSEIMFGVTNNHWLMQMLHSVHQFSLAWALLYSGRHLTGQDKQRKMIKKRPRITIE